MPEKYYSELKLDTSGRVACQKRATSNKGLTFQSVIPKAIYFLA
jgi:hypothetical protein